MPPALRQRHAESCRLRLGLLSLSLVVVRPVGAQVPNTGTLSAAFEPPRNLWGNEDTPPVWYGPEGQHWLPSTAKEGAVIRVHTSKPSPQFAA